MTKMPINILILGASYGLLPGVKLALAGNRVTFVGREAEIAEVAKSVVEVCIPQRRSSGQIILRVPIESDASPGAAALRTPDQIEPAAYDFIILAMQEPQFKAPQVAELLVRVAASRRPCLSIMNLPPPPFLRRLGGVPSSAFAGVYHSPAIWDGFDPSRMSLASPDPHAVRLDPARPGRLTVTLPSNFKAAPFADPQDQALLERVASDLTRLKVRHQGKDVRPPVALLAHRSLLIPLAKWPMLIAGNCRCLGPYGLRSIAEAVLSDSATSRTIYAQVSELALAIGTAPQDLVDYSSYAKAAEMLGRPSSMARALGVGATEVERVDLLVLNLMRTYGMDTAIVEPIVATIDRAIAHNVGLRSGNLDL